MKSMEIKPEQSPGKVPLPDSVRAVIEAVVEDYDTACEAGYDEEKWGAFGGVEALRELLDTPPIADAI